MTTGALRLDAPPVAEGSPHDRRGALLAEYGEVGGSFRLLTEIRFKLLALLPIAAGAATGLLAAGAGRDAWGEVQALALSLFGLLVTIALATYNQRNDQLYDALVGRAASIERELGLPDGAFANRPTSWFTIRLPLRRTWPVNHRAPVALIYGASVALWLFSASAALVQLLWGDDPAPRWLLACAGAAAAAVTWLAARAIGGQRTRRSRRMRAAAAAAVAQVETVLQDGRALGSLLDDEAFVDLCEGLSGVAPRDARARIRFYGGLGDDDRRTFMPGGPGVRRAAHVVALVTDLPAEWLEDCATERRTPAHPPQEGPP